MPIARKSCRAHHSMLTTNCPSWAARCRTVAYLTNNALIVSPGRRESASISITLVKRLSSSRALNGGASYLGRTWR
eukprot:4099340-Lingulodinium_polyedra.AAC.1